jgi:hypothetical protein
MATDEKLKAAQRLAELETTAEEIEWLLSKKIGEALEIAAEIGWIADLGAPGVAEQHRAQALSLGRRLAAVIAGSRAQAPTPPVPCRSAGAGRRDRRARPLSAGRRLVAR